MALHGTQATALSVSFYGIYRLYIINSIIYYLYIIYPPSLVCYLALCGALNEEHHTLRKSACARAWVSSCVRNYTYFIFMFRRIVVIWYLDLHLFTYTCFLCVFLFGLLFRNISVMKNSVLYREYKVGLLRFGCFQRRNIWMCIVYIAGRV